MNNLKPITILKSNNNSFELGCASELFINRQPEYPQWYQSKVLSPDSLGRHWATPTDEPEHGKSKMLIVPDDHWLDQTNSDALILKLRIFHQLGGRLVAFGSGIAILAATGLLDGKKVPGDTLTSTQKKRYPQVRFCNEQRFSCDSGLYCGGFGFAALELGLYLIGKDLGDATMQTIASKLRATPELVSSISAKLSILTNGGSPRIKTVLAWVDENLEVIENVDQLASKACLSRRSFDRQFRAALGVSPKDWLTQKRLNRAKQFLSANKLSIEEIAVVTGFGSSNNFRNNFLKLTGHSPTKYRQQSVI